MNIVVHHSAYVFLFGSPDLIMYVQVRFRGGVEVYDDHSSSVTHLLRHVPIFTRVPLRRHSSLTVGNFEAKIKGIFVEDKICYILEWIPALLPYFYGIRRPKF